jgi:hypothetical protein
MEYAVNVTSPDWNDRHTVVPVPRVAGQSSAGYRAHTQALVDMFNAKWRDRACYQAELVTLPNASNVEELEHAVGAYDHE